MYEFRIAWRGEGGCSGEAVALRVAQEANHDFLQVVDHILRRHLSYARNYITGELVWRIIYRCVDVSVYMCMDACTVCVYVYACVCVYVCACLNVSVC